MVLSALSVYIIYILYHLIETTASGTERYMFTAEYIIKAIITAYEKVHTAYHIVPTLLCILTLCVNTKREYIWYSSISLSLSVRFKTSYTAAESIYFVQEKTIINPLCDTFSLCLSAEYCSARSTNKCDIALEY